MLIMALDTIPFLFLAPAPALVGVALFVALSAPAFTVDPGVDPDVDKESEDVGFSIGLLPLPVSFAQDASIIIVAI